MGRAKTLSASDITRLTRLKTNHMLYKTEPFTSASTRNSGVSFSPFGNLASGDCLIIKNTFGVCLTSVGTPDPIVNGQILDGNDGSNVLIIDDNGGSSPDFILDGN